MRGVLKIESIYMLNYGASGISGYGDKLKIILIIMRIEDKFLKKWLNDSFHTYVILFFL